MEEVKININEFKSPEEQVEDVLEKLKPIIPIKFEIKKIELKIPAEFSGNSHNTIKQFGKILRENWENDGSLSLTVEIPGGLVEEFFDKLNSLTHGQVESKIMEQ